jgi:xanthine dehydrogenase YagS FAD-binding subunit
VLVGSSAGEREVPLLELYRLPTADNRALLALEQGEVVIAVRLPPPPDSSVYERAGERQAFSFPLVSVAAARRGETVRLVAAGVANVPRELDPSDPLAGLPGNPQSAWKRELLAALVGRALAALWQGGATTQGSGPTTSS